MESCQHNDLDNALGPSTEVIAPTDGELLMAFVRYRRDEAFAELVAKHAAMVLGVCRRILRDPHEAEDAFQATFLILVQRAGSITRSASVAAWLHQVAYRTAMRAAKRRQRRKAAPLDEFASDEDLWSSIARQEEQTALHEELSLLPESYRAALVLCYLEGKSRREAADELECTDNAVKARLARGKRMLRLRLTRRGIMLSAALTTAAFSARTAEAAGLPSLIAITTEASAAALQGSTNLLTANIASLTQQGVSAMRIASTLRFAVPMFALAGLSAMVLLAGAMSSSAGDESADVVIVADGGGQTRSDEGDRSSGVVEVDGSAAEAVSGRTRSAAYPPASRTKSSRGASDQPTPVGRNYLEQNRPATRTITLADPRTQSISVLDALASDEELSLEEDYLTTKIAALKMRAKAKSQIADGLQVRQKRLKELYSRGIASAAEGEGAELPGQELLARAEALELEAEILRLRRQLFRIKRQRDNRETASPQSATKTREISPGDVLNVDIIAGEPLRREIRVEPEGTLPLGAALGRVKVAGLTIAAAEQAILKKLQEQFKEPLVQLTLP